jgi:hypothetical protein
MFPIPMIFVECKFIIIYQLNNQRAQTKIKMTDRAFAKGAQSLGWLKLRDIQVTRVS